MGGTSPSVGVWSGALRAHVEKVTYVVSAMVSTSIQHVLLVQVVWAFQACIKSALGEGK